MTSFLDGSSIYGSSEVEMGAIRAFKDGLLHVRNGNANEGKSCLLPEFKNDDGEPEVYAGDDRAKFHAGLTSIHTLLLCLHNHIADLLKQSKSLESPVCDEVLFQVSVRVSYDACIK